MRPFLLSILLLAVCCSEDGENKLVKSYAIASESDIGRNYYGDLLLQGDDFTFISVVETSTGFILTGTNYYLGETVIVKTDLLGNFQKDIRITEETATSVHSDGLGGAYVITSAAGVYSSFRIRHLSATFEVSSVQDLNMAIPTFTKYFFAGHFSYAIRPDDATIEQYDFNGQLKWKKSLTDMGFPTFISPFLLTPKNDNEFTLSYRQDENLTIANVDVHTGNPLWVKTFSLVDDLPMQPGFNFTWGKNQKLYFGGTRPYPDGQGGLMTIINQSGNIELFRELELELGHEFILNSILPTFDGGSIAVISLPGTGDGSNFKLAKIDSKANPGWIGSFTQILADFPASLLEGQNGQVVILTARGYLLVLKPVL